MLLEIFINLNSSLFFVSLIVYPLLFILFSIFNILYYNYLHKESYWRIQKSSIFKRFKVLFWLNTIYLITNIVFSFIPNFIFFIVISVILLFIIINIITLFLMFVNISINKIEDKKGER